MRRTSHGVVHIFFCILAPESETLCFRTIAETTTRSATSLASTLPRPQRLSALLCVAWLPNLQHRGPLTDSDDGKAWNSESEYGAAAGASGTVCYSGGSDRRSLLYKLCQHNVSQGPFGEREREKFEEFNSAVFQGPGVKVNEKLFKEAAAAQPWRRPFPARSGRFTRPSTA